MNMMRFRKQFHCLYNILNELDFLLIYVILSISYLTKTGLLDNIAFFIVSRLLGRCQNLSVQVSVQSYLSCPATSGPYLVLSKELQDAPQSGRTRVRFDHIEQLNVLY